VTPIEGLEATQLASPDLAVHVEPLAGLEQTRVEETSDGPPQWTAGPLPLERTQHDAVSGNDDPVGVLEVDRGRENDAADRTPMPSESATCPWCGTPSLGAICDSCGRRKARYLAPAGPEGPGAAPDAMVNCPACFARVAKGARCSDCGMPFPLQEL
jgi:hypothetical protein